MSFATLPTRVRERRMLSHCESVQLLKFATKSGEPTPRTSLALLGHRLR